MHRWKLSILAAAAVMSAGLYATDANALALGRLTVQSALGEPLRAEIELPQITAAEADSLRAAPASPQVFRAQGMEVSPALNSLRVQLQRRSDGSMVLQLTSDRPINDPFVDLVLDATWNSGQIVRSYTMLFDPPALRRAPATVTASPQVTAPSAPAAAPAPRTPRAAAAPAPAGVAGSVTVQAGDTAGRLAAANRPAGVSLDQMLVAMMRSNPDAFIRGNVNRLKSGAVLQLPDETQARATPPGEARQIIAAQSRDFNEFRRRLAGAAPSAEVAAAERSASGKVQTQVEDRKPATAAPDKLTLSKGAVQGQKAAEDQVAKDKQASAASARMAELSKNISDLNKLGTASAPVSTGSGSAPSATASAATGAAVATGTVVPPAAAPAPQAAASVASAPAAPAAAVTPASAAATPASSVASAEPAPPVVAAPAPAPAPAPVAVPAPAPDTEEPGFFSNLFDDPMLPLAGGALLALLLGYGVYRTVQNRRNQHAVDSSFMESKLQPDSFFGASGGQRVDTASSQLSTGSSMAYSPSQLDAGGDVDPVAEADVYLAYGRDLQAEEILKEAVRHNPDRTSVHVKLGEIYAKRQDRKALEAVAQDVFRLTDGQGPDWARVSELGRELDPENPLYQPGGRPGVVLDDDGPNTGNGFASTFTDGRPQMAGATSAALPPDLDLDLDLADDALTEAPPAPPAAPGAFAAAAAAAGAMAAAPAWAPAPTPAPAVSEPPALDTGALDLPEPSWDKPVATAAAPLSPPPDTADLEFPTDLRLMDSAPAPLSSAEAAHSGPAPLEFDLGALSLDLDTPAGNTSPSASPAVQDLPQATPPLPDDPLATKLALAEEFNAIGDSEGARTLIEEVIAESSGALKTRAQRLLSELG
ncbi:FimV/HubP family polar landmark protein [Acidovorax sp. SUPP2539]|uniref:FimV/HubP family polar landmark protein n=1 Tax=Acidovorax sp. SUPP2539 TaxID=2920878 RepID=UPI0023DE5B35|nr:FimV/HubP family polar landmark protein [Acidovorax sp. SUPP2539]GKS90365.1 membrane protein [Acidovorax sp. SUPP2539]